jgi:hypothetical protein
MESVVQCLPDETRDSSFICIILIHTMHQSHIDPRVFFPLRRHTDRLQQSDQDRLTGFSKTISVCASNMRPVATNLGS